MRAFASPLANNTHKLRTVIILVPAIHVNDFFSVMNAI